MAKDEHIERPPSRSDRFKTLAFADAELKKRALEATKFLESTECDLDTASEDASDVGPETLLSLDMPYCDGVELPASAMLDFVGTAAGKWDGIFLVGDKEAFVHVVWENERAHALSFQAGDSTAPLERHFPLSMVDGGRELDVALVFGATPVALAVVESDYFDKYNRPYWSGETFVWVRHDGAASFDQVKQVVSAYLFELASSCQLVFRPVPREAGEDGPSQSFAELVEDAKRLRPLLTGPGIRDVTDLYLTAVSREGEYCILGCAKVFEYVAATAARMANFEQLRRKLLLPDALRPDAEYLAQLIALVESQAEWRDDRKAIERTVLACCDAVSLRRFAPSFCEKLKQLKDDAKDAEKDAALVDFAERLSDTRNQLSHAKANYKARGRECAPEQLAPFSVLVQAAADQAVRWFSTTDPSLRHVFPPLGRR